MKLKVGDITKVIKNGYAKNGSRHRCEVGREVIVERVHSANYYSCSLIDIRDIRLDFEESELETEELTLMALKLKYDEMEGH